MAKSTTTSSVEGEHTGPLLIVQRSVYTNPAVPAKPLVGEVVSVKDPFPSPTTTLHMPVPTIGAFPVSNVLVAPQIVWFVPAAAIVGSSKKLTVISSKSLHVPFTSVQRNT